MSIKRNELKQIISSTDMYRQPIAVKHIFSSYHLSGCMGKIYANVRPVIFFM